MLEAFLASPESRPRGTIAGIEMALRGSIGSDLPACVARLDLLEADGDGWRIVDFKTSRSAWSDGKLAEHAGQLALYADLLKRTRRTRVGRIALEFVIVTKAVAPRVQRFPVAHDADQLARTMRQLTEVWRGIALRVYPARPTWGCATCPFQAPCEAT